MSMQHHDTATTTAHHAAGRLDARPARSVAERALQPGTRALGLEERGRDGALYVPTSAAKHTKARTLVLLHGAGGDGHSMIAWFAREAERWGVVLVAPDARGATWDQIERGLGPDVTFLDRALARVFDDCAVDPVRLTIGGFSDGASYALTIGLTNGDLFHHVLAFSPGFAAPPRIEGSPRVFVSHGVEDPVLPIDACSRRLVPRLRRVGAHVDYMEFDGGHTIPAHVLEDALVWWLGEPA